MVHGTAAFILTPPGKVLDISALNSQHKFRDRGKSREQWMPLNTWKRWDLELSIKSGLPGEQQW